MGRFFFLICLVFLGCSKLSQEHTGEELETTNQSKKEKISVETDFNLGPTNTSEFFLDKTYQYGLEDLKGVGFYVLDLNNDFFDDLVILPEYYSTPEIYLFSPREKKFKKSSFNHFQDKIYASYFVFADFNQDRIVDALVVTLNVGPSIGMTPTRFFWGKEIDRVVHFVEGKNIFNEHNKTASSLSAVDINLDGYLDLFHGTSPENKNAQIVPQTDQLFLNLKNLKTKNIEFVNRTDILKGELDTAKNDPNTFIMARPTYGTSTCDFNQDGFADLMTVSSNGYGNKLWLSKFAKIGPIIQYENYANKSGYEADSEGSQLLQGGGNSLFSACADYNADGLMDIFLGSLYHHYDLSSVDRSSILKNTNKIRPFFEREELHINSAEEKWTRADRRANWVDLNLDGKLDLLVGNSGFPPSTRQIAFIQTDSHLFEDRAAILGLNVVNPSGTVVADFNHDGKPDILFGQSNLRMVNSPVRIYLFENNFKVPGKRISLFLQGDRANTWALGSMVTVETNKRSQSFWWEFSQGGRPSLNQRVQFIQLDPEEKISLIKVVWPFSKDKVKPLEKKYFIKNNWANHTEITLCESGKYYFKKAKCS